MIRPLRVSLPQDSLPLGSVTFQPVAIVPNTASGLNIPALQAIVAGGFYQTADTILVAGFNYFSLVAHVATGFSGGAVDVMAVPISATNPLQELDGISFGSIVEGGFYRVSTQIDGAFAFSLRFSPVGNYSATLMNVLELQLSHR